MHEPARRPDYGIDRVVQQTDGRHIYVPAQQLPQQPIIVRVEATDRGGQHFPPWLVQLIVVTVLVLAVVAVVVGAICAVVVIVGGTLMGIIGSLTAALPYIGMTAVGLIVAVGWAAGKLKGAAAAAAEKNK
mgnify:CR=1 FL=1